MDDANSKVEGGTKPFRNNVRRPNAKKYQLTQKTADTKFRTGPGKHIFIRPPLTPNPEP